MSPDQTSSELFRLVLRVGLPVEREGKTIYYRDVRLREVTVADERWAVRQAERLVLWQGQPRLVVSDPEHKTALTIKHIESFMCDGLVLAHDLVDMDLIGKLRPVDMAAIEERVFMIQLAAKLRYGEITQAQYDVIMGGDSLAAKAPQPVGSPSVSRAPTAADESSPVMLADRSGVNPDIAAPSLGD